MVLNIVDNNCGTLTFKPKPGPTHLLPGLRPQAENHDGLRQTLQQQ